MMALQLLARSYKGRFDRGHIVTRVNPPRWRGPSGLQDDIFQANGLSFATFIASMLSLGLWR